MTDLLVARPPVTTRRLTSLDVLRGLVVAFMVVVENQGSGAHAFPGTAHAPWNGLTPADVVLPSFLFVVGASLAMTVDRLSWARVARRSALLYVLGLVLTDLRPVGVLQHIAVCYLLVAVAVKLLTPRQQWTVAGAVLLWHALVPEVQPLGWGTVPSEAVNVLAGYWAARRIGGHLVGTGLACITAGLAWSTVLPLNKRLWSSSFVLVTVGIALVVFAAVHLYVDVLPRRRHAWLLEVFGRNAVVLYVASELVSDWLKQAGMREWLYRHVFAPWAGLHMGSLVYALAFVALWWWALYALYRRRIFVRV